MTKNSQAEKLSPDLAKWIILLEGLVFPQSQVYRKNRWDLRGGNVWEKRVGGGHGT